MNSNLEIIAFAFTSKSERELNSTQLGQIPEEVAAMAAMARALAGRRDSLKEGEAGWLWSSWNGCCAVGSRANCRKDGKMRESPSKSEFKTRTSS
mmetsp:Transcript_20322/g.35467  ORF Transcript_20322/g.35467 Transcript_20322/m.35467 type:complete len:95 (+) Transcript_20322:195-479(+)